MNQLTNENTAIAVMMISRTRHNECYDLIRANRWK